MDAASVEGIIFHGPHRIFVIEAGRKKLVQGLYFADNDELLQLVKRLIGPLGRRLDESSPMVDARLPDGSRLHAVLPPLALDGPYVTIRRFGVRPVPLERFGIDEPAA